MASGLSSDAALVLISLAEGPRHGTAILADVLEVGGRRMPVGTLYGTLDRLVGDGLVEALPPDGRRRPYALTAQGSAELATYLSAMRSALAVGSRRLALG